MAGDWTERVRRLVWERSQGQCEWCVVRQGTDLHHRKLRRHGDHTASNAVMLCRKCHDGVHRNPEIARQYGFIVPGNGDSAMSIIWNPRTRRWVRFDNNGGFEICPTK